MDDKADILRKYYLDVSNAWAFSSPGKVYRVLKKLYPGKYTQHYIQKWLNGLDAYSVQKQVRHKFKTAKVLVTSIEDQFDADLTYVGNLVRENDGVHYTIFYTLWTC